MDRSIYHRGFLTSISLAQLAHAPLHGNIGLSIHPLLSPAVTLLVWSNSFKASQRLYFCFCIWCKLYTASIPAQLTVSVTEGISASFASALVASRHLLTNHRAVAKAKEIPKSWFGSSGCSVFVFCQHFHLANNLLQPLTNWSGTTLFHSEWWLPVHDWLVSMLVWLWL